MATILLSAGTDFVRLDELAHLFADAMWPRQPGPIDDRWPDYGLARVQLDDELAAAVSDGRLRVRNPLSHGPLPRGAVLRGAEVSVSDLRDFASDRGVCVVVAAANDSAELEACEQVPPTPPGTAASVPLQRQRAQEQAILAALNGLGANPKALPPASRGNPSQIKQAARKALPQMSPAVFRKAWQRLRHQGEIADAK
jgi:hypothetical protein